MKEKLEQIRISASKRLAEAKGLKSLEDLRVELLGKKGELTQILKGMGALSKEERPVIGQLANEVRSLIEGELEKAKTELLAKENVDGGQGKAAWAQASHDARHRQYKGYIYRYGL